MLTSDYDLLERILRVFTDAAYDNVDLLASLEAIKIAEKAKRDEQARIAREHALEITYNLQRIEKQQGWDLNGNPTQHEKVVEAVEVKRRDVAFFCKERGLNVESVLKLVEERKVPVKAKDGATWAVPLMVPQDNSTVYERWDDRENVFAKNIEKVNERRQAALNDKPVSASKYIPGQAAWSIE